MALARNQTVARHGLLEEMVDARNQSDAVFDLVRRDSLYEPANSGAASHHLLCGAPGSVRLEPAGEILPNAESLHPDFEQLFAFGIDPVGGGLPSDQPSDWPRLEMVQEYVRQTRATLTVELERLITSQSRDAKEAGHAAQRSHRTPADASRDPRLHASSTAGGEEDRPGARSNSALRRL